MTLPYLHEYFRIHARRDAFIRLICFFSLFLYGLLSFLEENKESSISYDFLLVLFTNENLKSIIQAMLVISRQLGLVRLITRILDFPTNLHNLINNFNSKEKVRKLYSIYSQYWKTSFSLTYPPLVSYT